MRIKIETVMGGNNYCGYGKVNSNWYDRKLIQKGLNESQCDWTTIRIEYRKPCRPVYVYGSIDNTAISMHSNHIINLLNIVHLIIDCNWIECECSQAHCQLISH